MDRFEKSPPLIVYIGLALAMVLIFVADMVTPRGVAVWVLYLLPIAVTLYLWRPAVTLIVATCITVLLICGYFITPTINTVQYVNENIAIGNRVFGLITVWVVAVIVYYAVSGKLSVRRQEWLQSGQVILAEKMFGDQNLDELSGNILRFFAEYLNAQVGVLYVEEGNVYKRTATYAVPDGSRIAEHVLPGNGLIGQAIHDQRPFIIHDVQDEYFSFGSALGSQKPKHLIISPLLADGIMIGVMEFGFVHSPHDIDMDLINSSSQPAGVAIRSSKYRTRLQNLLEETQRQSEELQAQGEELRVSNEELEEQARQLEMQKDSLARSQISLTAQALELEKTSQYKSEFLANMSHELRTPLNSSLILAKLLAENKNGNLTPEQVKFAQTIHSAGNDLLVLINDILDLSKMEAGRIEIVPTRLSLSSLLDTMRSLFEPIAGQKKLKFITRLSADCPSHFHTDSLRLEQVLKNLIANAMKFTEKGEVVLEINPAGDGRITFAVRDTGIGIAEHQQQIIFEAFRQADGTTSRKYGGTGLGLSISRELARLLGGDISVNSQVGVGSTFSLTIPEIQAPITVQTSVQKKDDAFGTLPSDIVRNNGSKISEQAPVARKPAARNSPVEDDRERLSGRSRIILVIEDDESFAKILYELSHEAGFQCLVAGSAEEGLMMTAQYKPHAMILDMGLPDLSGLSVLDQLKRDVRTRHIPVHVISANDYSKAAFSLGAVGYMLKPVKREDIANAFEQLEKRLEHQLRRVLIVEDDQVQLESMQHLLRSRHVEALGVTSASDCLEQLKSSTFDCMVLDLHLPDASGFVLLETLSKENHYSFPPAIVYTGCELSPEEEQKLRRYSSSIIIKGAKSPERLLDEVTLFLHQVVAELPAEQQEMLKLANNRDATLEGKRILIVEDDVRNIFALTSVLEPKGMQILIARNGLEALETLERVQQNPAEAADLVLMDLMMPQMDGLTAIQEIRKRREWQKLPVIALTAKAMKSDQQMCLDAGANDYISKPFDIDKLLSLMRVWMPR